MHSLIESKPKCKGGTGRQKTTREMQRLIPENKDTGRVSQCEADEQQGRWTVVPRELSCAADEGELGCYRIGADWGLGRHVRRLQPGPVIVSVKIKTCVCTDVCTWYLPINRDLIQRGIFKGFKASGYPKL